MRAPSMPDAPSRAAAVAISRPSPGPTPDTTTTLSSSSIGDPFVRREFCVGPVTRGCHGCTPAVSRGLARRRARVTGGCPTDCHQGTAGAPRVPRSVAVRPSPVEEGGVDVGRIGIWSAELRYGDAGAGDDAAAESSRWATPRSGSREASAAPSSTTARTCSVPPSACLSPPASSTSGCTRSRRRAMATRESPTHTPTASCSASASATPTRRRDRARAVREAAGGHAEPSSTRSMGRHRPCRFVSTCLAALGPRMLELSCDRSAGAHPYLVPPEHTSFARDVLGAGSLLAPEQHVVLETDPEKARGPPGVSRDATLTLPNYVNNWRRFGFTEDDVSGTGSDRLVDAIVAWGDEAAIAGARAAALRCRCRPRVRAGRERGPPRDAPRPLAPTCPCGAGLMTTATRTAGECCPMPGAS